MNYKNSIPWGDIVVVDVKFFPKNGLYWSTAGVPITEYPYLRKGAVPIPISSQEKIIVFSFYISSRTFLIK